LRRASLPTLFPYTTLFRSDIVAVQQFLQQRQAVELVEDREGALEAELRVFAANDRQAEMVEGRHDQAARVLPFQQQVHALAHFADRKSTRLNSSHVKISYA